MKLSIAIPTFNRSYYLDNNLKQLLREYNNNFQIIVHPGHTRVVGSVFLNESVKNNFLFQNYFSCDGVP